MARVTYVKKAQPRYATVPVLGEDGKPIRVPVMGRNGEQKKTKTGRLVFMTKTVEDKSKPKPLRVCDAPECGKPIEIGTPYKHVTPKSGPYGGRTRARHASCPTWQVWELSNSLSARLAQVSYNATVAADSTDPSSVAEALRGAAEEVRSIAEEKREGAQNIEEGFGHPTASSEELESVADELESWAEQLEEAADEAEAIEVPDEVEECGDCESGKIEGEDGEDEECPVCGGSGEIDSEEYDDVLGQLQELLDKTGESPV